MFFFELEEKKSDDKESVEEMEFRISHNITLYQQALDFLQDPLMEAKFNDESLDPKIRVEWYSTILSPMWEAFHQFQMRLAADMNQLEKRLSDSLPGEEKQVEKNASSSLKKTFDFKP